MKHRDFISPFNERGNVEEVRNTDVWELHRKAFEGILTQKDKTRIFKQLQGNSYFKRSIPLMGVRFDFSPITQKYWVKFTDGSIHEMYAINKTSIRDNYGSQIRSIVEVK